MTPTRWAHIKEVVGEALDHETVTRAQFLAEVCADDATLRTEVESLLAHSENSFEACANDLQSSHEATAECSTGGRIGAYEVVRELGRGGMGAVYLARRADREFQREVAIKILKRGTDTDEVLRRFRAEREILARLEHPNIARLLDAGTTDEALPYFVMEHVVGARVTDYCFAQNLSIAERLRLFLKICGAVQFAHQNLVVHRDIKPANILITNEGEPKLLDFGIAKLLAADEGAFQLTLQDQQRLTPAYASPEQVRGDAITTVSDVYALGALLYELLVGCSPHKFAAVNPTPTELWHVVGEQAPPRPSLAAADKQIARQLRGDLDNILLTALRKEPARRYSGVGAFSEDLRHYLETRPVRARPATFGYTAGKFFSRNRTATVTALLALLALLGGSVVTIWNARRAELEARRAESHFQDVRKLANSFLFEFHDAIANLPGATEARQLVVSRAQEYLDKLARVAAGDRSLQLELAEAYLKIADVQGKPYTANLGDSKGALLSYAKAVEIAGSWALKEKGSSKTTARDVVSRAHLGQASVQARLHQLAEATDNATRALALGEQLLADDPKHADEWRRLLVSCHWGAGDAIQAGNHQRRDPDLHRATLVHYHRALALSEELVDANPDSASDKRRLAKSCSRAAIVGELGKTTGESALFDEALALHARSVEINEKLLQQDSGNAPLRRSFAGGLIMKASAHILAERDLEAAAADCASALKIQKELAAADPANTEAQQDLSYAHFTAGRVAQLRLDPTTAAEHFRASLAILEPLVAANPGNNETTFDLDRARKGLAEVAP